MVVRGDGIDRLRLLRGVGTLLLVDSDDAVACCDGGVREEDLALLALPLASHGDTAISPHPCGEDSSSTSSSSSFDFLLLSDTPLAYFTLRLRPMISGDGDKAWPVVRCVGRLAGVLAFVKTCFLFLVAIF